MTMQTTADILARGDWIARGEAPLLVSDPLQARWLLGLDRKPPSARARQRHEAGIISMHQFRLAVPRLAKSALREFERLLSGGNLMFEDAYHNEVVGQGLNELLDVTIGGVANDTTWFVGLTDGTPTPNAADTLASHGGWVEINSTTEYDGSGARPAWTSNGAASSQSVSNSSSPASYDIIATVTIGGSFLADVNTGNGTGNSLYSVGAFTALDKILNSGDTLTVTASFTTAAA